MNQPNNPIVLALRGTIWLYRMLISPLLGANCRYEPSCSVYAGQALERFGLWRGSFLAVKRIGTCHPWGGSGFDPVPAQHRPDHQMCCGRDPEFRSP